MTVYRRPIFDYDSLIREGCVNIYGGFDRNGADDGLYYPGNCTDRETSIQFARAYRTINRCLYRINVHVRKETVSELPSRR